MIRLLFTAFLSFSSSLICAQIDSTWLQKPKLNFSGYADVFYVYDFNRPLGTERQSFLYNYNRHNELNLNLGFIKFGAEHSKYRANFALQSGTYAIDNYASEPGLLKNIFEANIGISLNKRNNLWLDAGVLPSHIGFESAIAFDNWTMTRSLLAENSPYFLSGAKLTYKPNDKWEIAGLIMNGWQRIQRLQGNTLPSFGTRINFSPTEKLTLNWSSFIGTDDPDTTRRMRYFNNFYGQFQLKEKVGIIAGFDHGAQQKTKESSDYDFWFSPVIIVQVTINNIWKTAIRAEYYQDETSIIIPTTTNNGFRTTGLSLNIDYSPLQNIICRLEGRWLNSKDNIFETTSTPTNNNFIVGTSIAFKFSEAINSKNSIQHSSFFAGCNGQVKNPPKENVTNSISIIDGQAKMIKTQGNYNYRTVTGSHVDTNICIWAILEDKLGNIWVATMGEGVYRYDGKYFTNFTVADGLVANLVYSMIEDKNGNIWFGASDGVSKYDGETFTNFPFSVIRGNPKHQLSINTIDPLKEQFRQFTEVWSMLEDKEGNIWLGTTDGVYCYDGTIFTSIADLDNSKNSSLKHISVSSIAEDKAGNIWFTSWADGLCRFDGKSITKVTDEGFNTMFIDRNGHFWLGRRGDRSDAGLYRYDGKTFSKIFSDKGYMANITEDKSGYLWFSNALWVNHVLDGGVIHFNPSTSEIISRFTIKNGLSHDNAHAITIDKAGNVWFGMCGMTLTKYDGKTFTNFYSE